MLLFVYGTFLKKSSNHDLLSDSRFIANASIYATLYDTGAGFPAAVEEGTRSRTYGEIYEVNEDRIDLLDEFEGADPDSEEETIYVRKTVEAELENRNKTEVWVYIMPSQQLERFFAIEIKDGRWNG